MRFSYIQYDERALNLQQELKKKFEEIEKFADHFLPDSRPKSLLMTALEEAYMWSGKAIRDDQIKRCAAVGSTSDSAASDGPLIENPHRGEG